MTTIVVTESSLQKQVRALQYVTLGWMLIECSTALYSAWKARSVSLLAFGSDSLVELVSAGIVLLQFLPGRRISQDRAARLCSSLLYTLAGVVCLIAGAGLLLRRESDASRLGIAVTACALMLMPVLAGLKRKAADRLGNRALRADAVQSATCAYLAAITLAGLLLRLFLGVGWPDKVAALAAVPILIVEARRARKASAAGVADKKERAGIAFALLFAISSGVCTRNRRFPKLRPGGPTGTASGHRRCASFTAS